MVDVEHPGTSRNVLMAALHLAVGDWNLEHHSPGRQIGVQVPVDLRPPNWPDHRGRQLLGDGADLDQASSSGRRRFGSRGHYRVPAFKWGVDAGGVELRIHQ